MIKNHTPLPTFVELPHEVATIGARSSGGEAPPLTQEDLMGCEEMFKTCVHAFKLF